MKRRNAVDGVDPRITCGICWYPDHLRGGNLVPVIVPVRLACRVLRLRFHDDMVYTVQ